MQFFCIESLFFHLHENTDSKLELSCAKLRLSKASEIGKSEIYQCGHLRINMNVLIFKVFKNMDSVNVRYSTMMDVTKGETIYWFKNVAKNGNITQDDLKTEAVKYFGQEIQLLNKRTIYKKNERT